MLTPAEASLLVALMLELVAALIWGATLTARVKALEGKYLDMRDVPNQLGVLTERVSNLIAQVSELNQHMRENHDGRVTAIRKTLA